jgi:hypothetical protein
VGGRFIGGIQGSSKLLFNGNHPISTDALDRSDWTIRAEATEPVHRLLAWIL